MRLPTALTTLGLAALAIAAGKGLLAYAADPSPKGGSLVVTSSNALSNVTDLWVVDQGSRVVYLCRANNGVNNAPVCSKGATLQ